MDGDKKCKFELNVQWSFLQLNLKVKLNIPKGYVKGTMLSVCDLWWPDLKH